MTNTHSPKSKPVYHLLLLCCFFFLPTNVWAQQTTADGSVTDLLGLLPATLITALALVCAVQQNRTATRAQQQLRELQASTGNRSTPLNNECLAAEYSSTGLWLIDLDGSTLYMNPAMCQLLEIGTMAELTVADVGLTPADKVIAKRSPVTYLTTLKGHYGRHRSVLVTEKPILTKNGELHVLLRTVTDLSEPKEVRKPSQHQAA